MACAMHWTRVCAAPSNFHFERRSRFQAARQGGFLYNGQMLFSKKDLAMHFSKRFAGIASLLFVCSLILAACRFLSSDPQATEVATEIPPVFPTATPSPRILNVCLGQEPNTLYPFGGPNAAARSVLASIYDGPIDTISYEYQPVTLTQLPSLENGDAQIVRTPVQAGGQIVDADGNLVL